MNRQKIKYTILFLLLLIGITACKVQRPKEVLSEKKMEDLLYDYHLAKAMGDNLPYTENYRKAIYLDYVFKKHGTTEAIFDSSLVWYTRNTEVLSKIYVNVTDRLKKQQTTVNQLVAIRDNKPLTSEAGDSIDVWVWERLQLLSGFPLSSKLTFSLPSDSNFYARDSLVWTANYNFLDVSLDSLEATVMAMQILFENDSIISETQKILQSGIHTIILQSDTLGEIKEIKGFIYYAGGKDSLKKVLINDISLMRYHSQDTLPVSPKDTLPETTPVPEATKEAQPTQPAVRELSEAERIRMQRPRPASQRENAPVERNEATDMQEQEPENR